MTKPIKLFYTITDLVYGGGQTVIEKLLPSLDREKFTPSIVSLTAGDTELAESLREQGIPVYDLKMNKLWPWSALWRYLELIKREKPIIIHSSLFHANLASRIVSRFTKPPVLISWRQNIELGGGLREWINRVTVGVDDMVVAVCGPARDAEIKNSKVPPHKVIVIPNCVDIDLIRQKIKNQTSDIRSELRIGHGEKMLLTIGRLHPQKGFAHLLDALELLLKSENAPKVHLVIVGEGNLELELKQQVLKQGLNQYVTFTGRRSDIPQLLSAADLFILPSLWEGLPLVVLEAMAAKVPVIATNVGGTPEAIIDGETGLLVPPTDSHSLATAIEFLLKNESLCKSLVENGFKKVSIEFSATKVAQKLEDLYFKLLNDTG